MPRKQSLRLSGALVVAAALAPWLTACGGGDAAPATEAAIAAARPAATVPVTTASDTGSLSAAEIAGLAFMREEEKLAHDVYAAMFARWGQRIFANIADSESAHTEAILDLLTAYGLDDPAAGKPAGVFENPDLQRLHDALVGAGNADLVAALKVGALIEETDIRDIEARKADTDEAGILRVYDNLLCGSRNHLRAFDRALRDRGVSYVAQVITQAEWDAIAQSPAETCGR